MSADTFDFKEQLYRGEAFETVLDSVFAAQFTVQRVDMQKQKQGIDRVFVDSEGSSWAVEYKSDERAADTTHFFIETTSVEGRSDGWAHKTQADFIVFYVPSFGRVYVVQTALLKEALRRFEKEYPKALAHNTEYRSQGLLVPCTEIETLADVVYVLTLKQQSLRGAQ
jgi:hypothetical protein